MKIRSTILTIVVILTTVSSSMAQNEDSWWRKLFRRETVQEIEEDLPSDSVEQESFGESEKKDSASIVTGIRPRGYISIAAPSQLELLEKSRLEHPENPEGFRIQIFFGNLQNAKTEKKNFMAMHEDLECYLINNNPNFAVRIGDFRTELEAYKLLRDLKEQYPFAYVVPDEIEFPNLNPQPPTE